MAAPTLAFEELVTFAELKSLAGAAGPCITMAMLLPNPLESRTRPGPNHRRAIAADPQCGSGYRDGGRLGQGGHDLTITGRVLRPLAAPPAEGNC